MLYVGTAENVTKTELDKIESNNYSSSAIYIYTSRRARGERMKGVGMLGRRKER